MLPCPPDQLTGLLNDLCDAAAKETLPRFRQPVDITNKLENTPGSSETGTSANREFDPVTEADRNAEQVIRQHIQQVFPDHGIVGEEFGASDNQAQFQWIIDPVDGTRAFISGLPVWGTLIGLYADGTPVAGVMDQPFTGERYMAVNGCSLLFRAGDTAKQLTTSTQTALEDAILMTTSPDILRAPEDRKYFEVENQVRLVRYGCDCYAYAMLASGHIDLVIESGLNMYDIAALVPIIENAGGLVTNWQGGSAAQGGQILAAANSELHTRVLEILNS